MQSLIAFDISDNARRYRAVQILLDYGERVQESVFSVDCDDDLADRIRERLARVLNRDEDNLWWVHICQGCSKRIETMGLGRKPQLPEYFII